MAPVVPFPRPLYPPSHDQGAVHDGIDIVAVKRAISRAGFFPWNDFDNAYSEKFAKEGVKTFQQANGLTASGNYGQATHDRLRNTHQKGSKTEWAFDKVSISLMKEASKVPVKILVPALGPVVRGGRSVLNRDLTHDTDGIPFYPAFDDAFGLGRVVIAPEPMEVTKQSSSRPGRAFYASGASGIRWWFGHLDRSPSVGTKFDKGQKMGVTCPNRIGGGPHCHVGINVEKLWGARKQLIHHSNYTHGAPLIGIQLAAKGL